MIHIQFLLLTFNSKKGTSIQLLYYLEIMFISSSIFLFKTTTSEILNTNYYGIINYNIVYIGKMYKYINYSTYTKNILNINHVKFT